MNRQTKTNLTDEERAIVMVVAKAFFDDGEGTEDYPHTDVGQQYDEFVDNLAKGNVSWAFIQTCYDINK